MTSDYNQSLYFDIGQATYRSILLHNTTDNISRAKLTTYKRNTDGGSETLYLSTDNVSWESVTSGTAHTFSNTGTDLRFKITENNTSTGEISKITIINYH